MSKKFLRVLGICVLIIMLPVLITVAAVCLVEDGNGGAGNNTFVVSSDYGSSTKVELDKDGNWKISAVPTRDYYVFSGISVNEVTYAIENGYVVFTEEATEADFEKAVKTDKKTISAVWTCIYNQITIVAEDGFDTVDNTTFVGTININPNVLALETTGVLTTMNYSFEYPVSPLNLIDNNSAELDTITVEFADTDLNANGDFTVKTLLDKLAAQGTELQVAEGGIISINIF